MIIMVLVWPPYHKITPHDIPHALQELFPCYMIYHMTTHVSHDIILCCVLCRYIVDRKHGDGTVCLHKEWAVHPEPFPLQVTIADISSFAPEYREQATTLTQLFPVGAQCFITASTQYGCQAEVRGCDVRT